MNPLSQPAAGVSLDDIACSLGTDKSTRSHLPPTDDTYDSRPAAGHGYTVYYEHYLGGLRAQPIRLLEIGVLDGKSLATWSRYYPEAMIYGLDIDPSCTRFDTDRVKVFVGSQADPAVLADACKQVPEGFDVIIDDGSHYVKHMVASFNGLFGHLKPGGTYVIEDIHVAIRSDWGVVSHNRGMDLEKGTGGNDPQEMVRFLTEIRKRSDVTDLSVHLKKICFIRKASTAPVDVLFNGERGDRLEELYPPPPPKRTLTQRLIRKLVGR